MGNKKFLYTPDPYTGKPLCISDPKVGSMDNPTCNSKGEPLAAVATIPTHIIEGWMKDLIMATTDAFSSDARNSIERITEAMQNHLNHQPTHWKSWDDLFEACGFGHDNIRQYCKDSEQVRQSNRKMRRLEYMNGRSMNKVRQTGDLAPWSHPLRYQGFIDAQIGVPEPDREHTGK